MGLPDGRMGSVPTENRLGLSAKSGAADGCPGGGGDLRRERHSVDRPPRVVRAISLALPGNDHTRQRRSFRHEALRAVRSAGSPGSMGPSERRDGLRADRLRPSGARVRRLPARSRATRPVAGGNVRRACHLGCGHAADRNDRGLRTGFGGGCSTPCGGPDARGLARHRGWGAGRGSADGATRSVPRYMARWGSPSPPRRRRWTSVWFWPRARWRWASRGTTSRCPRCARCAERACSRTAGVIEVVR